MKKPFFIFIVTLLSIAHAVAFFMNYGDYIAGVISLVLFLLINYQYFKIQVNFSIVSFEFFFFISFFLSSVIFPVLPLEESDLFWVSKIMGEINSTVKWRFFNLALMGYYVYLLGLTLPKRNPLAKEKVRELSISKNLIFLSNTATLLAIVYFFYKGGIHLLDRYTGGVEYFLEFGGALSFVTFLFTISTMLVVLDISKANKPTWRSFFNSKYNFYVINSLLILPLLLLSGYRSQLMQLVFPIVYLYILCVNKISNKTLLLYIVIGFVLMIGMGIVRGDGVLGDGGRDMVYYLRDFMIEDVAGIWLVEYTDIHGSTGGSNAFLQMFSFIPFLGGFLKDTFGADNFAEASSLLFTYSYDTKGTGLGTNIIGDLYYTFGAGGVVICMFLLGFLINKLSQHKGIYSLLCFLLLLGNSVFATRVEFFYMVRKIGFSLIILWIMVQVSGKPRYSSKNKEYRVTT